MEVDVDVFERRVGEGTPQALEQAAELYRGDLLLGLTVSEPLFEEWLVAERERLREMALEALARLLAHQTKSGGTERAIQTAVRLLGLDPLQEAVHRTLMGLYARQGRRGAALKHYQVCVEVLQRELGSEPEAETKRLYQELLRRPPKAVKAAASPGDNRTRPAPKAASPRLDLPTVETPLIGREVELGLLRQLLDEMIRGRGHLAAVVGEAGIGKTRLLSALAFEALQRGCRVLIGRCHESDSILPFGPWVDACRSGELTGDEEILSALRPVWRAELSRLFPEATAVGLPSPRDSDLRLFEAVAQFVEQVAARQPLVLMLEDLHWSDEMSLRLLAFVNRRIPKWAVLIVTTAREEELADASVARRTARELSREGGAVPLVLLPLSRPDTMRLVHALARAGSDVRTLAGLEEQVWAVSEGNPFVAVETTRALQEGTALSAAGKLPLPKQVRELITSRLERLSDRARELVLVAAVIGREFDFALLQRAGGLDDHATAEGVEELVRRRVLRGTGERFDFSHSRVRAVVYDQLLPPQRRLRHRGVGEAVETQYADNLDPHYLDIGIHFREGEVWDKAVEFFRRAGFRATARSASREAVACVVQALGALEHLPKNADMIRLAIDLRLDLQSAYVLLGELPRMLEALREAEPFAKALGDERRLARVWGHMASCLWWMGQHESAVEYSQRALAIASALGDRSLEILARTRLGMAYLYLGEYRRVIDVIQPCTTALSGDSARERFEMAALPAVSGRGYLAASLASLGDFVSASAASEEALKIATAADHPYSIALAHFGAGRWRVLQGNFSEAIPWLELSLEACRREGFYVFSSVAAFTGGTYTRLGRLADGISLLEESAEGETATEFRGHRPKNLALLSEAYLLSGRLEDALRTARASLDLSRANRQRGFEAEALHVLGEIHARQDPLDWAAAEESYKQALELADQLEIRPLIAHCHAGLAKLWRRTGKHAEADEHLATATTMYREMGMTYWLEKAGAESEEPG